MFERALLAALSLSFAVHAQAPVEVMILGTFHMANPGHDLHNQKVPDVLAAESQAQLKQVAEALAAFKPTRIDVEWPKETVAERYPQFLAGKLAPSRNEVVQLGFRLGQAARAEVAGIDVDGDFPYEAVQTWAKAHGREPELNALGATVEKMLAEESRVLEEHGIAGELRFVNDPANLAGGQNFYRSMTGFGGGGDQPGAELLTAWYKRNFVLCARIAQQAKPGDRIVVMFGAGHAFLLRQCVSEMPGWKLVEPASFLPKT
ncbi:MAG TPA: DUF5694 domain-containing protein [Myxococcales bacterium]|nr:DUF5694 domain-containing protein [Myxococcales bacterium]